VAGASFSMLNQGKSKFLQNLRQNKKETLQQYFHLMLAIVIQAYHSEVKLTITTHVSFVNKSPGFWMQNHGLVVH
jgi:hypothetical protein